MPEESFFKNGLYQVTMKVPVLVISGTFHAILVARLRDYFQKEVHTWGSSSVLDTKAGVLVGHALLGNAHIQRYHKVQPFFIYTFIKQ